MNWRVPLLAGTAALVAACVLLQWDSARAARSRQAQGRALFEGAAVPDGGMSLQGHLAQQTVALPAAATRCINCHSSGAAGNAPASRLADGRAVGNARGAELGGALDARRLAQMQPRRGGPPSVYDAAALCRVLREGIDPASVMVDTAMPRYHASDAQCDALWAWLSRPPR